MDDYVRGGANRRPAQVQRAVRHGWTQTRRKLFLETLAATCNVQRAAAAAGMAATNAYALRQRDPTFAALWQEALELGYERLEQALLEYALVGVNAIEIEGNLASDVIVAGKGPGVPGRSPPPGKVEVQVAFHLLNRHRASVESGRAAGRSTQRATQTETDAALIKKLDLLAKRLKAERDDA